MKDLITYQDRLEIVLIIALLGKAIYELVVYNRLKSGKYVKSGKNLLSKYNFGFFFVLGVYLLLSGLIEYRTVGIDSYLIIGLLYILLFTYRLNRYEILFKNRYFLYRNSQYQYTFRYKKVERIEIKDEIIDIYIKDKYLTSSLKLPEQESTKKFLVEKLGDKVTIL